MSTIFLSIRKQFRTADILSPAFEETSIQTELSATKKTQYILFFEHSAVK